MRIVVTGASGFLGGTFFRKLREADQDCLGVSRSDCLGTYRIDTYSDTPAGDCLIHCAETNDRSLANAGGDALVADARRTLSLLLAKGYRYVIYASSAALYGDRWTSPRKITDSVTVVDTYTRIKRMSEEMVLEHGGAVVRFANLYGPGMASSNVVSHVLAQLGGEGIIEMQSLDPVRDFLSVHDAVRALFALIDQQTNGILNVGSGLGVSIRELVDLAQRISGTRQHVRGTHTLDRPSHLVLDISDTGRRLAWSPRIPLEEGIRELVDGKKKLRIQ